MTKRLNEDKKRELRAILKAAYDAVLAEDHSSFHDQIRELK